MIMRWEAGKKKKDLVYIEILDLDDNCDPTKYWPIVFIHIITC